jgi:hypothetical protein
VTKGHDEARVADPIGNPAARPARINASAAKTAPLKGLPEAHARMLTDTNGKDSRKPTTRVCGHRRANASMSSAPRAMCQAAASGCHSFAMNVSPSRICWALGTAAWDLHPSIMGTGLSMRTLQHTHAILPRGAKLRVEASASVPWNPHESSSVGATLR